MDHHVRARGQSWANADRDIRDWLSELIDQLRLQLGDELIGICLHGSLAMGCYHRPKSDVDLLVVVERDLPPTMRRTLTRVFLRSHEARPTTGGLEVSIVTRERASRFRHPMPFEVHFSAAWVHRVRDDDVDYTKDRADPDLAAHVTVARERGVPLFGADPKELFSPVPFHDYVASIEDDFNWIVDGDNILTTPFYGVLNACRVVMVLESGEGCIPSKVEAGEWALRTFERSQHAVLQQALDCYRDGGAVDEEHRQRHGHDWDAEALRSFAVYAKIRSGHSNAPS